MKTWQTYLVLALLADIDRRVAESQPSHGTIGSLAQLSLALWSLIWMVLAAYHFFKKTK